MKRKILFVLTALIFFLLISSANTFAQYQSHQDSLKGLKGVAVFVEDLEYDNKEINLTTAELKTTVETKLRDTGLLLENPLDGPEFQPLLVVCVRLQPISEDNRLFAFYFELSLYEPAKLAREPKTKVISTLWRVNSFGALGIKVAHDGIIDLVQEATDRFIYDYYNANMELNPSYCRLNANPLAR